MITDREDSIGIQIDRTVLSVRDAMDGMTEDRVVSSIWVGLGWVQFCLLKICFQMGQK